MYIHAYIHTYIRTYMCISISISISIYIYIHTHTHIMVAIFCPFSQFCEIGIILLSLQKQPKTAPNLFQRGVEYGK